MKALYLKDVRCFGEPRCVPIAPLTLLVGENSTGKSSFLALARIAAEVMQGNLLPNFNSDPFFLGAYDQIAHYRGGRGGRAKSFEIGIDAEIPEPSRRSSAANSAPIASWRSEFVKRGSQPGIVQLRFECGEYSMHLKYARDGIDSIAITTPNIKETISGAKFRNQFGGESAFDARFLSFLLFRLEDSRRRERKNEPLSDELRALYRLVMASSRDAQTRPYAIAPVRTKPERTYNPIEDTPKSEGSHVPMVLAKTYFTDKKAWERIRSTLNSFGHASGLFEEIALRTLGKTDSDPFQIMLKIAGPPSNLIDVGYGVSQVLPIVVDLIMNKKDQVYLLQQPEVHLHPRAQAELASFLSTFTTAGRGKVLVETHSDHILDRVRMEVQEKKTLKSKDVVILFFERHGLEVKIYPIFIDEGGNLINQPDTYRRFFMEEERRLLGLS